MYRLTGLTRSYISDLIWGEKYYIKVFMISTHVWLKEILESWITLRGHVRTAWTDFIMMVCGWISIKDWSISLAVQTVKMALTLKLAVLLGAVLVNLIPAEGKILRIYVVVYIKQLTLPLMWQQRNVFFFFFKFQLLQNWTLLAKTILCIDYINFLHIVFLCKINQYGRDNDNLVFLFFCLS